MFVIIFITLIIDLCVCDAVVIRSFKSDPQIQAG